MTMETAIPDVKSLTSAPLRHRLRIELNAPVSEVWALIGSHVRMPEFSAGIAAVELERDVAGAPVRVCKFRSPDGKGEGPALRERVRWEAANVGYAASSEPGNPFGLEDSVELVTMAPASNGTTVTWDEYYNNPDLPAARASFDDGLADIGERLVAKFGGRVVERFLDGPR